MADAREGGKEGADRTRGGAILTAAIGFAVAAAALAGLAAATPAAYGDETRKGQNDFVFTRGWMRSDDAQISGVHLDEEAGIYASAAWHCNVSDYVASELDLAEARGGSSLSDPVFGDRSAHAETRFYSLGFRVSILKSAWAPFLDFRKGWASRRFGVEEVNRISLHKGGLLNVLGAGFEWRSRRVLLLDAEYSVASYSMDRVHFNHSGSVKLTRPSLTLSVGVYARRITRAPEGATTGG